MKLYYFLRRIAKLAKQTLVKKEELAEDNINAFQKVSKTIYPKTEPSTVAQTFIGAVCAAAFGLIINDRRKK